MISCRILCKNTFNLFVYFKKKDTKIKVKSFECPKSIKSIKKIFFKNERIFAKNFERNYEKIILGTSDAWPMKQLSH